MSRVLGSEGEGEGKRREREREKKKLASIVTYKTFHSERIVVPLHPVYHKASVTGVIIEQREDQQSKDQKKRKT